jgi:stearoyl-CoA desaturase (delta-9 desaturase)
MYDVCICVIFVRGSLSFMTHNTEHKTLGLRANEKALRDVPTFSTGKYQINWVSCAVLLLPPLLVLCAIAAGVPLVWNTLAAAVIAYFWNGLGITVGYHRLFSHRAFAANRYLSMILSFAGAGAFQGSVKWWGRNHRIHHRYIDTDRDPYNAMRGFFFTHMGWMLMKQDYSLLGHVDIADYHCSRDIMFQHNHYFPLAMISGIIIPTLVCGLGWGDWWGGYFYAALAKTVCVHHSTFCINSLAHTSFAGARQNYSDKHSSHDSFLCALATMGEGYHNFHHEFAQDYRNGIRWYHFDPSKWIIRLFEMVGLAKGLVRTPNDVIARNTMHMQHKRHMEAIRRLEQRLKSMEIVAPEVWSWSEVEERVNRGQKLTIIGDYVLDLQKTVPTGAGYTHKNKHIVWYDAHPGGRKLLDMYVGKDATEAFTGGVYQHHEGAMNVLPHLRVASLQRDKY